MNASDTDFLPFSLTRSVAGFAIGNLSIAEHRKSLGIPDDLTVSSTAWLTAGDLAAFLASGCAELLDSSGAVLARHALDFGGRGSLTVATSFLIRYPWDLIRANEQHVSALVESKVEGDVHSSAVIEGVIQVGPGTRILPGVFIEGNVIIGADCKIGPNCYIRGSTSIGDRCHIGQSVEIKNCLILSNTNVGHLSYVGDSVLGEGVNFGAGTTTSNLRHDGKNHRSMVGTNLIDTGRRKFGAIVGDRVHTGINTSIYPGRKLWPGTTTRPGAIVQRDLQS
jgi:UDP-N-acetylglucosamine diphosphorylase / glucose-1-phosphate thymidylyltransferase / UDP-N-acetylgalactosamine diphosphorylase / glucosamine-1-phosphate N-acetyltransferase / galactosamine-1-phosphate N-acetyltransferase